MQFLDKSGLKVLKRYIDQSGGSVKQGTTAYWNNSGYVAKPGEIIVYTDYKTIEKEEDGETVLVNVPGIKVGTGNAYVADLPFMDEGESQALTDHINNTTIHTNTMEKSSWDNKLNIDESELSSGNLIFNRS